MDLVLLITWSAENHRIFIEPILNHLGFAAIAAPGFTNGAADITNGATKAINGAADITNGAAKVINGAADITNGAAKVINGAADITNGAAKVINGAADITNGAAKVINAAADITNGDRSIDRDEEMGDNTDIEQRAIEGSGWLCDRRDRSTACQLKLALDNLMALILECVLTRMAGIVWERRIKCLSQGSVQKIRVS